MKNNYQLGQNYLHHSAREWHVRVNDMFGRNDSKWAFFWSLVTNFGGNFFDDQKLNFRKVW